MEVMYLLTDIQVAGILLLGPVVPLCESCGVLFGRETIYSHWFCMYD
jgi:hypothetical protein